MKQKTILTILAACIALSAIAFSSVVSATEIRLDWTAPSQRVDGTAFTDSEIQHFRIYYGTKTGVYDAAITVIRATPETQTPNTYTLALPTGSDYFFAVTTVDTEGREAEKSKEIQIPLENYQPSVIDDLTVIEIVITIK